MIRARHPREGKKVSMRSRALLPVLAALLVMAALPLTAATPAPAPPLAAIEADVERARREFEIPGVAVAVVKDGRVVLAKGYGVKRHGGPPAVDGGTPFPIASHTKALTSAPPGRP